MQELTEYVHSGLANDLTINFSDKLAEMQKVIADNMTQASELQKVLTNNLSSMNSITDSVNKLGNSELIRQLQDLTNGMNNLKGTLEQINSASQESLERLKKSLEAFNAVAENFKKQTDTVLNAMLQNTSDTLHRMEEANKVYLNSQHSNLNTIKYCVIAIAVIVAVLLLCNLRRLIGVVKECIEVGNIKPLFIRTENLV